jgi:hypothetical protein
LEQTEASSDSKQSKWYDGCRIVGLQLREAIRQPLLLFRTPRTQWQRRGDHLPFLGLGPDGESDGRSLVPGVGYAVVGSEIWLYYSAYNCTHIESLDGKRRCARQH